VSDDDTFRLFTSGRRFLEDGHPGQAALLLERAATLTPEKTSIREALGRAYYALGRYRDAAAAFSEVVRRRPADDYAHFGLARSLLAAGDAPAALAAAKLALAMAPGNEDYRRAVAECRLLLEGGTASPGGEGPPSW